MISDIARTKDKQTKKMQKLMKIQLHKQQQMEAFD
jgi:hypothetical protein